MRERETETKKQEGKAKSFLILTRGIKKDRTKSSRHPGVSFKGLPNDCMGVPGDVKRDTSQATAERVSSNPEASSKLGDGA